MKIKNSLTMKKIYFLLIAVFCVNGVWGQTLYEDFNYTVGGNIGGNLATSGTTNNNWTTHSNSLAGTINVLSGSLNYTGLQSSTGNRVAIPGSNATVSRDVNRAAGLAASQNTTYFSFLLNVVNATQLGTTFGTTGTNYFMHLSTVNGTAAANFTSKVHIRSTNAAANFRLGISETGNTPIEATGDLTFGTTYLVVVKYVYNNTAGFDLATIWVNPASLGGTEPSGGITGPGSANVSSYNSSNTGICIRNAGNTPNAEIDEIRVGTTWAQVTPSTAGTPTITVSPATLTGFAALSGVNSAQQSYNVGGTNLTANIVITPPVGFGISTANGGPYTFNPTTISLTPTAGTVSSTPIYVVMNSTTLGVNSGNITHTSTGATTLNVALTGNVVAAEPTVQSAITIGAVTNSTVVVNFTGGNGARRILLARLAGPVNSDPIDGTTYTANANFGNGTQIGTGNYVVYDGTGNTQLVTGLTAGATYHFAIYEYNNGGVAGAENYLVPGGLGNATLLTFSVPYVWIGLNGDWQMPANWAPARLFPATNDSLLFISNLTDTIINIPTQTVGYIGVSLNTNATFQSAAANNVLTVGNLTGADLFVEAGSSLNIAAANALTLRLVSGATGSINGSMRFTAGAHRLTAVDAGAVTFNNVAVFTAGTGFSGNSFGTVDINSIVFASGSRYDQITGSNPFGATAPSTVLTFQTGSLFRVLGNNFSPSFSGRTYANVEFAGTGTSSMTGGSAVSMDTLKITSGIVNINMTATPGHSIKGTISVAAVTTLNFAPASAGTFNLNGTSLQTITNAGTLTFSPNQNITVNNAAGITLNSPITLSGTLTFTSGLVNTSSTGLLTMAAGSSVAGASNTSYVRGPMKKIGNTPFVFPVGQIVPPDGGFAQIGIGAISGGTVTDEFVAEYRRGSARTLGPVSAVGLNHVSGCDYWTLDKLSGSPTLDITCYWSSNNTCGGAGYVTNLADLVIAHFNGTSWDAFGTVGTATGTVAAGTVVWNSVSTFSPFSLGSISFNNPLPITINYFNGTRNNGNHLLNWKVTCVSTPSATIELERSIDGRNYNSIYNEFATALRCQQPFNYTDAAPAKGVNYYRLKMTDVDGKVTYSSIVSLINAVKGIDIMNIAPNPIVSGSFNLKVSSAEKTQIEMLITDMQGRVLQKQTVSVIAGFNLIPVNVKNLATGTYQLVGNTVDGRTRVLRFVIQ